MMICRAIFVFLICVILTQTEGCEEYDLVVIMEGSYSMTKANFELMKDFVKDVLVIADVDSGQVQVGVVIYSTKVFIQFQLNTYDTSADILTAIDNISYPGGQTNTADALKAMRTEMFTPTNGDRPNVQNIAILMTDGVPDINYDRSISEAQQARDAGIHIYVVGISVKYPREIYGIASRPEDQFIVKTQDFSDLRVLLNETFFAFCKAIKPRLTNGTEGRLEILTNGGWGTVCDNGFGSNEAKVACRMLGFHSTESKALAASSFKYGEGLGDILSFSLVCNGTETSLEQCSQTPFSFSHCSHSGDVGIMCNITTPMAVRLADGTSEAGRLEIFVNEEWYTVCDEDFGTKEIEVACRMLGFNSTEHAAAKTQHVGSGSKVRFQHVKCQGLETTLGQCEFGQLQKKDCMDVSIICDLSKLSVRLTGTKRTSSDMGRVEVEVVRGQYSRVCVGDETAAKIICRQLNLPSAIPVLTDGSSFGRKKSPLLDTSFNCTGNESSIFECTRIETTEDCLIEDTGVYCNDYHTVYIVSESDAYPLLEGAGKVLKCVTPQGYGTRTDYIWHASATGRPHYDLLTFSNLTKELNGSQVTCSAVIHRIGFNYVTVERSETLVLKVYFRPLIRITWSDYPWKPSQTISDVFEVVQGHNVTLWCKADSNPLPASITWSGRVNSTTGELRILAADHVTHSGVYTCTVVTQTVDDDDRLPLTSSYELTLSVEALELRLTCTHCIRQDMGRVEVKVRDVWGALCGDVNKGSATVICRQLGLPHVTAMTTTRVSPFGAREDKDFVVTDLNCTGRERNISHCVHNFIGLSDRCKTQQLGIICSGETSHLYVVLATKTNYPTMEGANISLKCENPSSVQPATNYTWPKSAGGRPVGEYLIFDNVTRDHNRGQVMCAAFFNDTSQLVHSDTSTLQVYYSPSVTIISNSSTCTPRTSSSTVCAVTRGRNATFLCIVDSNPRPGHVEIILFDLQLTQKVTITAADPAIHDGQYKCHATRDIGNYTLQVLSTYSLLLAVQYPPSVLSFQLNVENQTLTVAENSNVTMLCSANGRPAPRMLLIRGSDHQQLTQRPQGDIQLNELNRDLDFFLCQAHCQDSGDYICKVDNGVGQDSKTVRLLVQCSPRTKTSQEQSQYLEIRGNNRNFSINMIAYPTPQAVRVTYQSLDFKSSVKRPLTKDTIIVTCGARPLSPAEVTCHISVTQADVGVYHVVFSNYLGNLTVDFLVTSDATLDDALTAPPWHSLQQT